MVILVDENDNPVGTMPKMEAHEKAMLHRAFSVFILNANDEVLLQQRANDKYHSAGLWTNTCCSHPHPGEDTLGAARRRLKEEMGMEADLQFVFKFMYKAPFDNLLTEHEIDHVFIGKTNQLPVINPGEVASYKYMKPEDIKLDMEQNPQSYTVWFRIIFNEFYKEIFTHKLAV